MPYLAYGPTVDATTRVDPAIAANACTSDASATISGHWAAAAGRPARIAANFSADRPARPIRTRDGAALARYSATRRPTKPVAP